MLRTLGGGDIGLVSSAHQLPRGVWGHAPPGIFLGHLDPLRSFLVHFQTTLLVLRRHLGSSWQELTPLVSNN